MSVATWCVDQVVREYLGTVESASEEEIAGSVGIRQRDIPRVLVRLEAVGWIERIGVSEARWRLRQK